MAGNVQSAEAGPTRGPCPVRAAATPLAPIPARALDHRFREAADVQSHTVGPLLAVHPLALVVDVSTLDLHLHAGTAVRLALSHRRVEAVEGLVATRDLPRALLLHRRVERLRADGTLQSRCHHRQSEPRRTKQGPARLHDVNPLEAGITPCLDRLARGTAKTSDDETPAHYPRRLLPVDEHGLPRPLVGNLQAAMFS